MTRKTKLRILRFTRQGSETAWAIMLYEPVLIIMACLSSFFGFFDRFGLRELYCLWVAWFTALGIFLLTYPIARYLGRWLRKEEGKKCSEMFQELEEAIGRLEKNCEKRKAEKDAENEEPSEEEAEPTAEDKEPAGNEKTPKE